MFPFAKDVVINRDWEQNVLVLLVFAVQRALNLTQDWTACQRVLGADYDQFVVNLDAAVNLAPDRLAPFRIFWKIPHACCFGLQVSIETLTESLILTAVTDEAGVKINWLADERADR